MQLNYSFLFFLFCSLKKEQLMGKVYRGPPGSGSLASQNIKPEIGFELDLVNHLLPL
jgi:hypothetical protein